MDRYVEDCPEINIGLLQRQRLFVATGAGTVEVGLKGGAARFSYEAGASQITAELLHPRRSGTPQRITIRTAQMTHGERRYFLCPLVGVRASKLYLVGGVFASRPGHGLKHLSQTGKETDAVRARTIRLAARLTGTRGKPLRRSRWPPASRGLKAAEQSQPPAHH